MQKSLMTLLMSLGVLGVGVTSASGDDVFHACFKDVSTKVRASSILVNATPVCKSGETPRTWDQSGPGGAQGAEGPQGPAGAPGSSGPAGPQGPSGLSAGLFQRFALSPTSLTPNTQNIVGHLALDPGKYIVTAKVDIVNDDITSGQEVVCQLNGTYADQSSLFLAAPDARGEVTMILAQDLSASGGVDVVCGPERAARAFLGVITAVKLEALTDQS